MSHSSENPTRNSDGLMRAGVRDEDKEARQVLRLKATRFLADCPCCPPTYLCSIRVLVSNFPKGREQPQLSLMEAGILQAVIAV